MALSVLWFIPPKSEHDTILSSSVRQRSFQGIDVDLVTDPSLKSTKGSLHLKSKDDKIVQ